MEGIGLPESRQHPGAEQGPAAGPLGAGVATHLRCHQRGKRGVWSHLSQLGPLSFPFIAILPTCTKDAWNGRYPPVLVPISASPDLLGSAAPCPNQALGHLCHHTESPACTCPTPHQLASSLLSPKTRSAGKLQSVLALQCLWLPSFAMFWWLFSSRPLLCHNGALLSKFTCF